MVQSSDDEILSELEEDSDNEIILDSNMVSDINEED